MVVVDGLLRSGRGNGATVEVFLFCFLFCFFCFLALLLWFMVVADGGSNSSRETGGFC